jgi:hypothetical protein
MLRPVVVVMFALTLMSLLRPVYMRLRTGGVRSVRTQLSAPRLSPRAIFPALLLCLFAAMLAETFEWETAARIVPIIVAVGALFFGTLAFLGEIFPPRPAPETGTAGRTIHMDIASHVAHLPTATKLLRGAGFFGWIGGFLAMMATVGLIPTVPLFVIAYMRIEGRERWSLALPMATVMTLFIYGLFDRLLSIPWPPTLLGTFLPALKIVPSV